MEAQVTGKSDGPVVSIEQGVELPGAPSAVFDALMNEELHAEFTGSAAAIDARVGGRMSAWDGYIEGIFLELEPPKRIVQTWRTSEWPAGYADSRLEITLAPASGGTLLTMVHSYVPRDQAPDYEQGWWDSYWEPLRSHLGGE